MLRTKPLVSILMSVYNGEKHLKESIISILEQDYDNFEFLIINDGSTDNSELIIRSFDDHRIRLINNKKNIGLAAALNKGLSLARGKYVARMDADDISMKNRLSSQVGYLDDNPKVSIVGSWVEIIGSGEVWKYPTTDISIKSSLLFYSPFAHPTVMFRLSDFVDNNFFYDPYFLKSQDYELWSRVCLKLKCSNINKIFLKYRVTKTEIDKFYKNQIYPNKVKEKLLKKLDFKDKEITMLLDGNDRGKLVKNARVAYKLIKRNQKLKIFPGLGFAKKTLSNLLILS